MPKAHFVRKTCSRMLLTAGLGAILAFSPGAYANTLINPAQFAADPSAIMNNIGPNTVNLLTGGGNTGNIVPPDAIASALNQGGANLPPQAQQIFGNLQQGLMSGQMSPDAATKLVTDMVGGALPPELAQAMSGLQNLGNIMNGQAGIQELFNNPLIKQALGGLVGQEMQALGLDKLVSTAVSGGAQGLTNLATGELANQITQNMPELANFLSQFGDLQNVLSNLFGNGGIGSLFGGGAGGGSGGGGGNGGGGGGGNGQTQDDGNYELQSLPVDQSPKNNACGSCSSVGNQIADHYKSVRQHIKDEFIKHRTWIVNDFWKDNILPAMMLMAEQLTAVGIAQVQMFGTLLDAKHQLETQRLFQQMTAQAHKDYHPSEGMCTFGTTVRSLAASERKSELAQATLSARMMQRQTLSGETAARGGGITDMESRVAKFISTYCDPNDNAGGLLSLCQDTDSKPERRNIDVDYTRNVESRLTLDFESLPPPESNNPYMDPEKRAALIKSKNPSPDEEDLFALTANLFAHNVSHHIPPDKLADDKGNVRQDGAERLLDMRAIFAKRSVAQNSFAAIASLRAAGEPGSAPYTKALIKELGVTDEEEIEKFLGENPSYFAQMEVLTKKIYQNPAFYTELYDKPVNVERKGAAIQAISLMQDRDLYNSLLRSEAVLSILLETMLEKEQDRILNTTPAGRSGGGTSGTGREREQ